MKFDRSGENESQFMQALVPMVDLSAVRLQREWDIWGSKLRDSGNRC